MSQLARALFSVNISGTTQILFRKYLSISTENLLQK
jgi:hypothetical protein